MPLTTVSNAWREDGREVSPEVFIPLAERCGLINELGAWVIAEACRSVSTWAQQGLGQLRLSVNVSALQIRSPEFVEWVRESLEEHQLDASQLVLEITETTFVAEIESASHNLASLRELGVLIALDDFGTGYCSMSYLQRFPVDIVKIDRQFIDELDEHPHGRSLARLILQLTAGLEVTSVAEGIERPEQLRTLKALGCDVGQGYLLSGPLEADELDRCLGAPSALAVT